MPNSKVNSFPENLSNAYLKFFRFLVSEFGKMKKDQQFIGFLTCFFILSTFKTVWTLNEVSFLRKVFYEQTVM